MWVTCVRLTLLQNTGGGLVFKGRYRAQVQKHGNRVVFQGEACTARAMFRVPKTANTKKKVMYV